MPSAPQASTLGLMPSSAVLPTTASRTGETRSWLNVGFCSAPELDDAIIQAEAGSSYAWVLYADENLTPKTVAMLQSHTHSVFFCSV